MRLLILLLVPIIACTPKAQNNTPPQCTNDAANNTSNTNIETEKGQKIYNVYYKDKKSAYYEKRKIKEDIDVIWFEKLLELEKESFPVTYFLYAGATGYLDEIDLNS